MEYILALLLCIASLVGSSQAVHHSVPGASRQSIVTVQKFHGRIVYTVDSKPTGNGELTDLLHLFYRLYAQDGAKHPVFIYLDPNVPLIEMRNIEETAWKAQLENLRFFMLYPDTHSAKEIKLGNSTPYPPQ